MESTKFLWQPEDLDWNEDEENTPDADEEDE